MRDHIPITIEDFKGLWMRGDPETTPADHFSNCNNIKYSESSFLTRDGIDPYFPFKNIVRQYTFVQSTGESILALDTAGNIYHSTSPTPNSPILSINGMTDFAFVGINGRAFISPSNGLTGLSGQFLYVYLGDGTAVKKAGGSPPTGGGFSASNSASAGNVEAGFHIFGVVFETNTGFLTQIGPTTLATVTAPGSKKVTLSGIPTSADPTVVARQIVGTKVIQNYNGDQFGYEFFFVPGGRIADNVTTTLDVSFFDADLLNDASNLLDLFVNPPAGVALTTYHNRLVIVGEFANPGIARVSNVGEPEAFDQVTGLLTPPLTSTPLTNAQEYRDVLYVMRDTRTYAYTDSGDVPTTWAITVLDQGIGCPCHGIGTVLDSGGVSADFLVILFYGGLYLFNGSYIKPELSYKIKDFFATLVQTDFKFFQIYVDTINQIIYVSIKQNQILIGDFRNGLDPQNIKWGFWTFNFQTNTITLINGTTLLIGADGSV